MSKNTILLIKHAHLMTVTLTLVKKGLMILSNSIRVLKNKINMYKLEMFEEWVESQHGNNAKDQFIQDKATFSQYYEYITGVIDSEISQGLCQEYDRQMVNKLRSSGLDVSYVDYVVEQVLVHLLHCCGNGSLQVLEGDTKLMKQYLLMLNFFGLVLDLESLFPFYSSDLRQDKPFKKQMVKTYTFGAQSDAESEINQSENSMMMNSQAFYELEGQGLFNWEAYFRNLENKSDSELRSNLLKYSLKKDSMLKDSGCQIFQSFKKANCFGS